MRRPTFVRQREKQHVCYKGWTTHLHILVCLTSGERDSTLVSSAGGKAFSSGTVLWRCSPMGSRCNLFPLIRYNSDRVDWVHSIRSGCTRSGRTVFFCCLFIYFFYSIVVQVTKKYETSASRKCEKVASHLKYWNSCFNVLWIFFFCEWKEVLPVVTRTELVHLFSCLAVVHFNPVQWFKKTNKQNN